MIGTPSPPSAPDTFEACFERLIGHEGGYVNDPRDPGGETKFGISKRSYPHLDIALLTLGQAKAIYQRDYWDGVQADALPEGLRFHVFDAAVNSGPGTAARWLQSAVGVAQDGRVGPITLQAVREFSSAALVARYSGVRLAFMASLSSWRDFGRGWANRIAKNLMESV
jgi:lysozyme family protein